MHLRGFFFWWSVCYREGVEGSGALSGELQMAHPASGVGNADTGYRVVFVTPSPPYFAGLALMAKSGCLVSSR